MNNVPYALAFVSLQCAYTCIRFDLSFVVDMFGSFQSNLGKSHLKTAKMSCDIYKEQKFTY